MSPGGRRIWRGLQPDGQLGPDEAIASAWVTVTVPSGATHLFFTR